VSCEAGNPKNYLRGGGGLGEASGASGVILG